jgi:hypothetical protein
LAHQVAAVVVLMPIQQVVVRPVLLAVKAVMVQYPLVAAVVVALVEQGQTLPDQVAVVVGQELQVQLQAPQ